MEIKFSKAKITQDIEGAWLSLKLSTLYPARRFVYKMKGEYTADIKEYRARRSLDANAYAWVLIGEIAKETHVEKSEVYRLAIREVGGNYNIVCVKDEAVKQLCEGWQHNGLGWITDVFDSKIEGCSNVVLYCGSSCFSSKQMNVFIDNLVQDAQALGIDTRTPEEIARMKDDWYAKTDKANEYTGKREKESI